MDIFKNYILKMNLIRHIYRPLQMNFLLNIIIILVKQISIYRANVSAPCRMKSKEAVLYRIASFLCNSAKDLVDRPETTKIGKEISLQALPPVKSRFREIALRKAHLYKNAKIKARTP